MDIDSLLADGLFPSMEEVFSFFDFTEINANNKSRKESEQARELAFKNNLPLVSSSDAHFAGQVGSYYTIGYADSVRASILENRMDRVEPDGYWSRYYTSLVKSGLLKTIKSITSSNNEL